MKAETGALVKEVVISKRGSMEVRRAIGKIIQKQSDNDLMKSIF